MTLGKIIGIAVLFLLMFMFFPPLGAILTIFIIPYAIYCAIKGLMKYNHDLNHQDQRKDPWED